MNKTIVFIIFCILLAGILYFVYINYEPTSSKSMNVSIIAEDGKDVIVTGYQITTEEGEIISGNTSTSYELVKVPSQTITLKNINIGSQTYYEDEHTYNITQNTRINIKLNKPDLPKIKISDGNPIEVNVTSKNFKDIDFCLIGSTNYLFIKAKNYTEITKLEKFKNYDRCYDGAFSLNGNTQTIYVEYTNLGIPGKNDYINISLIDRYGNTIIESIK